MRAPASAVVKTLASFPASALAEEFRHHLEVRGARVVRGFLRDGDQLGRDRVHSTLGPGRVIVRDERAAGVPRGAAQISTRCSISW